MACQKNISDGLMMNTQQNGSILMTALLFLIMMTSTTLLSMSSSILQLRMSRYETLENAMDNAAENALSVFLNTSQKEACLFPLKHPDSYTQQPAAWWLSQQTCLIQDPQYQVRYIIESLKTLHCQTVQIHQEKHTVDVDLKRVTIWVQGEDQTKLLQTEIALISTHQQTCLLSSGSTKLGVQTRRKI